METAEPRTLTEDLVGTARASPPPDGFPRTATFAASARKPPLGVREPPAPHTARAGPRSEAGALASGLRLNSSPGPRARRGLTRPPRLVTLGGTGGGTAGGGRGSEPGGGRGSCSREDFHHDEIRSEKGKLHRRGGRGGKPGSGRRKRQGERDLARCANSREMAPESRDPRHPLSSLRLRP